MLVEWLNQKKTAAWFLLLNVEAKAVVIFNPKGLKLNAWRMPITAAIDAPVYIAIKIILIWFLLIWLAINASVKYAKSWVSSMIEFFTSTDQVIDKRAQQKKIKKAICNFVIVIVVLLMKVCNEKMSNKLQIRIAVKLKRGSEAVSITWLL